jgi:hypothetical protein
LYVGYGCLKTANKSDAIFEGEWKDGHFIVGTKYCKPTNTTREVWIAMDIKTAKKNASLKQYIGEFCKKQKHGFGITLEEDGSIFEG